MQMNHSDTYQVVYSLGVVAADDVRKIAMAGGRSCIDCRGPFTEGDLVTLVRDIYGVAWVHDACIREEV